MYKQNHNFIYRDRFQNLIRGFSDWEFLKQNTLIIYQLSTSFINKNFNLFFFFFYVYFSVSVLINVECRLWAKNIVYGVTARGREGSGHFELLIDDETSKNRKHEL